jgi:putative cardiolipin synthase
MLSTKAFRVFCVISVVSAFSACAQLPKDYPLETTSAITGTDDTALGLRSIAVRQEHPEKSRVIPLVDGVDAFYARAALTVMAERSLDVQYFLWHKDVTGQVLLKLVLDAADRGVRVRMLLDDLDNQALDLEFYALDTHPNISIRLFNPFATRGFKYIDFLTDPGRVKRRMHNKSFTVDNQYTIIGGRNIGDEYFDAREETNFYDMDVLATGPLVNSVSNVFDIYWNHEIVVPIYAFDQNTATADDLENVRQSLASFKQSQRDSRYADDVRSASIADALRGQVFPAYVGEADVIYDDPNKGLGMPPEDTSPCAITSTRT